MRTLVILITMCISLLSAMAQAGKKYIIHSSGSVLGIGAENRAVLVASTDEAAQPLTLQEESDGSYTISTDGKLYLSLGTSNGWSTYFVTSSTDSRAHYYIEEEGSYVKLKNKHTSAYLGTDESKAGASVYSDKSGSDIKHRWRLSDTPAMEQTVDTTSYSICPEAKRQVMEGWGVSLCWWANMCGKWSDKKIDELIDWMVSPDGLNWNIFRYNIGGGDDPNWTNCYAHHMGNGKGLRAEMEGFQDERNGEFHWERDAAQRKIMLKIKEKRPDTIFEAFSNSCPWWMTVSGCCSGNEDGGKDNLKPEYYEDFANYLVEVCKHYKEAYGIEFRTLEPFNESVTNFWYKAGAQEGCHFDFASQVAFVKVLEPMLKKSGLNTIISAADETNIGLAVSGLKEFQNSNAASLIGQWNSHTYSADNRARSQFGSLARAEGKGVWMSETGSGGSGIAGNLSMAQRLIDDVRYIAPNAWVDWQYMEEANDQWCVVRGSFSNATYYKVKNYYVRQQVTRFIKQGYSIVHSAGSHSLAAISPDGNELVAILLNADARAVHRISLPMARITGAITAWRTSENESLKPVADFKQTGDSLIDVTLPDQSITTLIIPISLQQEEAEGVCDGDTYMIVPQSNAEAAAAASASKLSIEKADAADPAQRWTVKKTADGTYRLVSGNGLIPTYSSQYTMSLSKAEMSSQTFRIEDVDGIHVKICPDKYADKAWDLESQSLSFGTKIGVWAYGNSAAADHRNWMLVKVASSTAPSTGITDIATSSAAQEEEVFTTAGIKVTSLQKGLNIIKTSDGKRMKVMGR